MTFISSYNVITHLNHLLTKAFESSAKPQSVFSSLSLKTIYNCTLKETSLGRLSKVRQFQNDFINSFWDCLTFRKYINRISVRILLFSHEPRFTYILWKNTTTELILSHFELSSRNLCKHKPDIYLLSKTKWYDYLKKKDAHKIRLKHHLLQT